MDSTRESEEKRKENFYKSTTLFVDIVAKSKRLLLKRHISSIRTDLSTFLNDNKHELLHMCYYNIQCFECDLNSLRYKKILSPSQLETVFNQMGPINKEQGSRETTIRFCCYVAKDDICVEDLDITLLRTLLVNFCTGTLWASCLQDVGKTEPELLNQHKHDLYHMWQKGVRCCCCDENNNISAIHSGIEETKWYAVFSAIQRPLCDKTLLHFVPDDKNVCVREARHGINVEDLTHLGLSSVILNNFCPVKKAIEEMVKLRNVVYAHALKDEIEDGDFMSIWTTTTTAILKVAEACQERESIEQELQQLKNGPLNVLEAERHKTYVLQQISDNTYLKEEIMQELHNFSQRVGRSFTYLEEELSSLRTYIDKKFSENARQNFFVVHLLLEHGKYKEGQFQSEATRIIDNDESMQNNEDNVPWRTNDDDVHEVQEEDNTHTVICGQCHVNVTSLDRFVSHRSHRCDSCKRQIREENSKSGGMKWIAEIVLSGANFVFENMSTVSLSSLAWEGITPLDFEIGSLILWVEIDMKYFKRHISIVNGIDKFLQHIFHKGVVVKAEPRAQLDIYVRLIDGQGGYEDNSRDKFVCGLCKEVHNFISEYLAHCSKCHSHPRRTLEQEKIQAPRLDIIRETKTPEEDPMYKKRKHLLKSCKTIIGNHPSRRSPLNIAVIGPRRCGKSSFLNTVFASLNSTKSSWSEVAEIGELQNVHQRNVHDHVTWYFKRYAKKFYYNPTNDNDQMPTFYDMSGFENSNSDQIKVQLDLLFTGHIDVNKKTSEVLQHGVDYGVAAMRTKYKRKVIDKINRIIVVCTSNPSEHLPIRLLRAIREIARERDIRTYGVFTHADKYKNAEREEQFVQVLGIPWIRFATVTNYCQDADPSYYERIIPSLDVPVLQLMKQVLTPGPNDLTGTDSKNILMYAAFVVILVAYMCFIIFST